MKRCRVGDLALIIWAAPDSPESIGKVVEVIRELGAGIHMQPDGVGVFVPPQQEGAWEVRFAGGIYGAWSDKHLLPLRPDKEKSIEHKTGNKLPA